MSRMITKAAALTSLFAAAMAGTTARAQVIDLRYPPYAQGPSARPHPDATSGFGRGASPYLRVDHQGLTLPGAGAGAFPGQYGPIGQQGAYPAPQHHQGGYPAPQHHQGGFPAPGRGAACPTGPSPAIGAVDALIGQVGAFLQVFSPTAHCVPEGDCIERDAAALYQSAVAFRQAAQSGAPPQVLAGLYAEMDGACCRLVSRVNRISRGRTGPNIQQVQLIGALCNQIRALI